MGPGFTAEQNRHLVPAGGQARGGRRDLVAGALDPQLLLLDLHRRRQAVAEAQLDQGEKVLPDLQLLIEQPQPGLLGGDAVPQLGRGAGESKRRGLYILAAGLLVKERRLASIADLWNTTR